MGHTAYMMRIHEQFNWKTKTTAHTVLGHYMPQPPTIKNILEEVHSLDALYDTSFKCANLIALNFMDSGK